MLSTCNRRPPFKEHICRSFFNRHSIMKTKNIVVGLCLLATAAGLAFSGCKSETVVTQGSDGLFTTNTVHALDTNRVANVARQAAQDATINLTQQHPDWVPYFQTAETDLKALAAAPNPSLNDLLAIVQRLPVKQLKGSTAQLSFEGATLLLSAVDIPQMPATAAADIHVIAQAIADGVAAGLPAAPSTPPPTSVPAN